MGLVLQYPAGATPLDPDEAAALIPSHITTQKQLNAWELSNVIKGERWAFDRSHKNILSSDFMRALHKRMFSDTWKWAGNIRRTEKNIGIAPENICRFSENYGRGRPCLRTSWVPRPESTGCTHPCLNGASDPRRCRLSSDSQKPSARRLPKWLLS